MEAQAEEHALGAQKEKKLRDRSEQYSRQLEEELAAMKVHETYFYFADACIHNDSCISVKCYLKECAFDLIEHFPVLRN